MRMFAVSTYCIGAREPNYAERTLLVARNQADFKAQAQVLARQLLGLDDPDDPDDPDSTGEKLPPTPPLKRRKPIPPRAAGQIAEPFYHGDYEIRTDSAVVWFADVKLPAGMELRQTK